MRYTYTYEGRNKSRDYKSTKHNKLEKKFQYRSKSFLLKINLMKWKISINIVYLNIVN